MATRIDSGFASPSAFNSSSCIQTGLLMVFLEEELIVFLTLELEAELDWE